MPSLSLGSDSLGLGNMFAGSFNAFTNAGGTEECGTKPTCLSFTKTCKDKNKTYNECRMKALDVKQTMANNMGRNTEKTAPAPQDNSKNLVYAVIGVVVLIVLVKILKN